MNMKPKEHNWKYQSIDTRTGEGIEIDMEEMMIALNKEMKWDYVRYIKKEKLERLSEELNTLEDIKETQ